jgi:hypothetical protein
MTLDIKDEDCEIPMTANENPLQLIQILYQNLSKISGPYVINFHDEDLSDNKETNSSVASGHQLTPTAHNPSRTMLHESVEHGFFYLSTIFDYEYGDEEYRLKEIMRDSTAIAATINKDTMYVD